MPVSITELKRFAEAVSNQTRDPGARKLAQMVLEMGECPVCAKRRADVRAAVKRYRAKKGLENGLV